MKTHLVLCCNRECAKKKMNEFIDSHKSQIHSVGYDIITTEGSIYVFVQDINNSLENLPGCKVHSIRACEEYVITDEVRDFIEESKI